MIKRIDREACRIIRAEIEKLLPELGKRLGLSVTIPGGGSFSPDNVTFKIQAAVIGATGKAVTKEASAFKMYASRYGLDPSDLNKTFTYDYTTYEIVGLKPRSYRFPILAKRYDGKVFKLPADGVAKALGRPLGIVPPDSDESGDSFSGVAGPVED